MNDLVRDAKKDGRFVKGANLVSPAQRRSKVPPGSLFVVQKSATTWSHVGIVSKVNDTTFDTLEGNTGGRWHRWSECTRPEP
ncbi:CHAP domain-containing protein [Rhizobium leguminosarum]